MSEPGDGVLHGTTVRVHNPVHSPVHSPVTQLLQQTANRSSYRASYGSRAVMLIVCVRKPRIKLMHAQLLGLVASCAETQINRLCLKPEAIDV